MAHEPGSKATMFAGSLSSPNRFRPIDPEDPFEKKRGPKKNKQLNPRPAEPRYVSPPDPVKTDEQSRAGLRASAIPSIPLSPLGTSSPILSGMGGWVSRDRHGFDTLHSPHQTESVKDYAQVTTEPRRSPWNNDPQSLLAIFGSLPKEEDTAKGRNLAEPSKSRENPAGPVKAHSQVAAEPPGELVGSSDNEEEQEPDTSVRKGLEGATSQTRGKYWPRGVLSHTGGGL